MEASQERYGYKVGSECKGIGLEPVFRDIKEQVRMYKHGEAQGRSLPECLHCIALGPGQMDYTLQRCARPATLWD